jgi:DNA-binding NarL/FixJ family response regulator
MLTETLRVRLLATGKGLPSAAPTTGPVEVVLAGAEIPPVTVAGKRKPKVVAAAGVDNAFDLAGTGTGDVQVMVVDVDQFGVGFVHDLHMVFPTMKIVALSRNPKLLAASLKAGATVALPASTPSPTLAAIVARLLKR